MGRLVENQASARTGGGYGRSRKEKPTNQGKDKKKIVKELLDAFIFKSDLQKQLA